MYTRRPMQAGFLAVAWLSQATARWWSTPWIQKRSHARNENQFPPSSSSPFGILCPPPSTIHSARGISPTQTCSRSDKKTIVPAFLTRWNEMARGATEDQAAAAVKLQQYGKLPTYTAQREVTVRRMYKELKGNIP